VRGASVRVSPSLVTPVHSIPLPRISFFLAFWPLATEDAQLSFAHSFSAAPSRENAFVALYCAHACRVHRYTAHAENFHSAVSAPTSYFGTQSHSSACLVIRRYQVSESGQATRDSHLPFTKRLRTSSIQGHDFSCELLLHSRTLC
jgi:hypothetical protein